MRIVWRLILNAAAIWVAAAIISDFEFDGSWVDLAIVAAIFGLVNAVIRPIAKLLTFPINIATLGLFTFVINAFMVMITAAIADSLSLGEGFGSQFLTALLAAIVISIVSTVLSWVLPDGK